MDDLHLIQFILTEALRNSVLKQKEGEYEEVWGTADKAAFQTFPVAENCILGDILVKSQKKQNGYWEQIQWNYKPVFIWRQSICIRLNNSEGMYRFKMACLPRAIAQAKNGQRISLTRRAHFLCLPLNFLALSCSCGPNGVLLVS